MFHILPDSIIVTSQNTGTIALECVPDIAIEVIVSSEEKSAWFWKCHWGYSANDWFMAIIIRYLKVLRSLRDNYLYMRSSWSALISNNRQVASSEPVPKAWKLGKKATAFMSDSWPVNVCIHRPVRTSHSLAAASQPPDTNVFLSLLKWELEGERRQTSLKLT